VHVLERLLAYADTYGPAIPLAFIFFIFKIKQMPRVMTILSWYLLSSVVIFGISNYMADRRINNLFLYHLFCVVELSFLLFLFREIIQSEKIRKSIPLLLLLFVLLFVLNSIFLEQMNSWNSNSASIEFLIIICFSFIYYFELANSDAILSFSTNAFFWIVSGLFVYCASCSIVFAFYKYAAPSNGNFTLNFWMFQIIMYLVKNILITKGILCFKARKSISPL
jgi:hypothetical protein